VVGGVLGNAVANALLQVGAMVLVGHLVYDLGWPRDWLELVVFTLVGVLVFGSIGVALAHAIPNFDAVPAYTNLVVLPLIFISGTFYSTDELPGALDGIANVLPLKHAIDGLRDAMVDGGGLGSELGHLAALAAWAAVGVTLAVRYFRWEP
jgi:ABC-type multidrug transport system permease subunit